MTKASFIAAALGSLGCVALAGCGSDDEDGDGAGTACGTFAACGGDVSGSWAIEKTCGASQLVTPRIAECPDATFDTSGVTTTGTISFDANKTYSTRIDIGGTTKAAVPPSCLVQGGAKLSCRLLEALVMPRAAEAGFKSIACTGTTSCTCTATLTPTVRNESGTYATAGNVLSLMPTGAAATAQEYCVTGNTLRAGAGGGAFYLATKK